ncbi:MAG: hypothetical protein ACJAVZ_004664 [Afipia broomeae]
MLLSNRRVELGTKLPAVTVDIALGCAPASSVLPAFEALGKPQKLEVIVTRHAGSVFGQMLQPCRARSPPNLIGNGVPEIRLADFFATLDHSGFDRLQANAFDLGERITIQGSGMGDRIKGRFDILEFQCQEMFDHLPIRFFEPDDFIEATPHGGVE